MRRVLVSDKAPSFSGSPLSPGIETEQFVFAVGMAVDERTGTKMEAAESVEDETRICLDALDAVLREAGSSLRDVVKTTVYLAAPEHYEPMNAVYREYWDAGEEPVRCSVFVGLGAECRVEIDAVAVKQRAARP